MPASVQVTPRMPSFMLSRAGAPRTSKGAAGISTSAGRAPWTASVAWSERVRSSWRALTAKKCGPLVTTASLR